MRWIFISLILFSALFSQTAKVRFLMGDVTYKPNSFAATWQALKLDASLQTGAIVKTGSESLCEIEFSDGSVSKVLANSLLEIRKMPSPESDDGELITNLGKFFFYFKKRFLGKVKIRSSVGVAAIRGTQFYLIDQPAKTSVWVREGAVELSDPTFQNSVMIKAGFKSEIASTGIPSAPAPLTQQELAELEMVSEGLPQPAPEQSAPEEKMEERKPAPDEQPEPRPAPQPQEPQPQVKPQTPAAPEQKARKGGLRTGVSLGAVTIDGQIYNQIGVRPEFSIGKVGVALDLTLYLDQNGNIRKENWDSFKDIVEKIYYVRWAQRGDPFYLKIGAIDNYRLGFGLLMNRYSNTVEYPGVIRTGMEIGMKRGPYGFDGMVNNFSEVLSGGGLFAGRFSYRPFGALEIGLSLVYDRNQYKGLKDRDGDGIPDLLDDFPDNKNEAIDSDGDGIPDSRDFDRDGDGFTDNLDLLIETFGPQGADLYNEQDSVILKPEPFDVDQAKDKSQIAIALDASYPILTFKYLQLTTYAQYAKYPYNGAWGITFPGFWAKFAFINAYAEYRVFGKGFLPEYFNTTYELERATYKTANDTTDIIIPYTKRQYLNDFATERLRGFVIGADFDLWNMMIFGAEYQNMSRANVHFRTLRANLDLNTSFIPRINRAGAYYYQNNAIDLFKKTEGTILGYRLEYEISPSASLLIDFRQTYRDVNGDGKISGSNETVKTTIIQTVMRF
ncbi:FecR domain-containing protein [Calditrichota bacterium LG25]